MAKLNCQQALLQFSVSRDASEIILICWFGAQETFQQQQFLEILNKCIMLQFFLNKYLSESVTLESFPHMDRLPHVFRWQ